MSPRSLLFSSDEEGSSPLIQALRELELEVEHCPEIFGAIDRITSRKFDVIVTDWDEGPEACFLLKTSRELKLNNSAFALAIASEAVRVSPKESGADLMLKKPLTAEQVKYGLLGCDKFLACMRIWVANDSRNDVVRAVAPDLRRAESKISRPAQAPVFQAPAPERPVTKDIAVRRDQPSPAPLRAFRESSAPASLGFAMHDGELVGSFAVSQPLAGARKLKQSAASNWRSRSLSTAAVVVAFFSLGYALSQPAQLRNGFIGLKTSCKQAAGVGKNWFDQLSKYEAQRRASSTVMASAIVPQSASSEFESIRVVPARYSSGSQHVPAPGLAALPTPNQPNEGALTQQFYGARIPQSLEVPQSGEEAVRTVGSKLGASLIGEMEPVSLSESLSMQMLLQKVQPSYPEQALRAGLQGPVVLQAWIRRDGTIRDLKLIRGSLVLGRAAYSAVKQWRYKPYLRNGEAVEAQTYVTIDFRLPQQSLLSPYSQ
jgi:TonB family protein